MARSTMFLSNLSVVDHAYIDHNGEIVGGSFNPSFLVSGDVDETEQVVIDFSTCKKDLKAIIDDKETGIDHKLWIGNFSKCTFSFYQTESGGQFVKIKTPVWDINVPANAVHLVDSAIYDTDMVGAYMQDFVNKKLQSKYPGVQVTVYNNTETHGMPYFKNMTMFRYTHGLKDSTSWGCQNIAHGHLSYVSVWGDDEVGCKILSSEIANFLDRTMFVYDTNLGRTDDGFIKIQYTTERGAFTLERRVSDTTNILVLPHETTIEHLVDMIARTFEYELKEVGAYELYVSEGLTKGAVHYVKYE